MIRLLGGLRFLCWWLFGVLLVSSRAEAALAPAAATFEEYEVKAALIFKLAKFIEWPPDSFSSDSERFTVCVIGRTAMGLALERAVEDKSIGGRQVHVRRSLKVEELTDCQIAFTGSSKTGDHTRIAAAAAGHPVLLVGEAPCFTHHGGMVNFFVDSARLRFEINPERAEKAGLAIDPNVLRLARIIGPDTECKADALHS